MSELQEKYITELLDPRTAKTPRENAAAEEIKWLRSMIVGELFESWKIPPKKAEKDARGAREVKT